MREINDIGHRVEQILAEKGLKRATVSKKMGRSPDYLRGLIEGRVKSPTMDSLQRLAEALDVQLDRIIGDAPSCTTGPPGFSDEPDLIAWKPKERDKSAVDLARMISPDAAHPVFLKVMRPFLGFSILSGDLIAYDLNMPPKKGQLVVTNAIDPETSEAQTTIRMYLDPYLVGETKSIDADVELADGNRNAVMGPIVGVLRGMSP